MVCLLAWSYCFALSLPPLFGWSRYIPEGFFTSCSWDYSSRTAANRAFYIYLLIFGFILPAGREPGLFKGIALHQSAGEVGAKFHRELCW
ncbi:hypothetical protein LSTR_LSTR013865 [Laodelphax striatellus]|uniref:G-protein coupled receptors family 1 profile domain-containing protein n=1 Tax=Laodelphax striatellus TaxID=195883 RepID=A0A482WQC9_LAOST|nr:hypothetical protein LSTR_LSTR013865 [Laodelphax striatellus]